MGTAKLNSRAETVTLAPTSTSKPAAVVNVAAAVRDEKNSTDKTNKTDREHVMAAVADMQEHAQSAQRNLNFKLDDDSQRMIVTVTEASTGKIIRQMPSEEALRLSENLDEIRSVLFSGKV